MKQCRECKETKTPDSFHRKTSAKDGLASSCKECKAVYDKEYEEKNRDRISARRKKWRSDNASVISEKKKIAYRNNPEKQKESSLKNRYNITLDEYNVMLKNQNFCCAICGGTNGHGYSLSIDHDHSCCPGKKSCGKCIRKLLCNGCNVMIGYAKEDVSILQKAIEYLQENQPSGLIA